MFINFFKIIFLLLANLTLAQDFNVRNNPALVSIIPSNGIFLVEENYYFGVKIELKKGWKTYWKNPGDAGAPITIEFNDTSIENKLKVLFPFPEKFTDHGVSTIGYEGHVIFPVRIHENEIDKINEKINLDYLVCKDICIPISETKNLNLDLQNVVQSDVFLESYKTVPKRKSNYFNIDENIVSSEKISIELINNDEFENIELFAHAEDTNVKVKKLKSSFEVFLDNDIGSLNGPIDFSISNGDVYEEISFDLNQKPKQAQIIYFIILAFFGGLILNFMPCVLPILSLKLYSFLSLAKDDGNKIRFNCSLIIAGIVTSFIVFFERAMRKILINYPKRQIGNKMYGGESSHLPLKINTAGVIPAIFASALLLLPITVSNFGFAESDTFLKISSMFTQGQPLYMLLYASGIIFFSFFYTSIVFNPKETAENLRKYGGYIPGIRPGERTAEYIDTILIRLTTVGSLYLTFVCLMPEFLIAKYPIPFYLGGTSILIVVVVAMDTVTQVQTRLMSSQYESLIKKTKFGK